MLVKSARIKRVSSDAIPFRADPQMERFCWVISNIQQKASGRGAPLHIRSVLICLANEGDWALCTRNAKVDGHTPKC